MTMLEAVLRRIFNTLGTLLEGSFRFLRPFSSVLNDRYYFESRNTILIYDKNYPIWFHVSSEGELEQVMPILEHFIGTGKEILLWFTSPSVEKKVKMLCEKFPNLTSHSYNFIYRPNNINALMRPKVFFMVRYDFFPRLIDLARNKDVVSILINAATKNKTIGFKNRFWYKFIFHSFNVIFWANDRELERGQGLSLNTEHYSFDFRHERILNRQKTKKSTLSRFDNFLAKSFPHKKRRIILGSLWAKTARDLKTQIDDLKKAGYLIVVAPHQLKGEDYKAICDVFSSAIHWQRTDQDLEIKEGGDIILCHLPGLLCDLYPFFGHCYVDGGFGRSVHSLIEPFWGGGHVYCGPATHRSTEYDFIKDHKPKHITMIPTLSALKEVIIDRTENKDELDDLTRLREDIHSQARKHREYFNRFMDI